MVCGQFAASATNSELFNQGIRQKIIRADEGYFFRKRGCGSIFIFVKKCSNLSYVHEFMICDKDLEEHFFHDR